MKDKPIVILVTDSLDEQRTFDANQNNSEGYSRECIIEIIKALHESFDEVIHFDSLMSFIDELHLFKKSHAVVVPAYFGKASPCSKALVPAICESYGLDYIGADAYTQAICNDKYLSKLYASSMGISSGDSYLVRHASDLSSLLVDELSYPVVVKPNYGGGSNGITESSICDTPEEARRLAQTLLKSQRIPIIIESYLMGFEVQATFATMPDGTVLQSQASICLDDNDFFTRSVFGLESKKRDPERYRLQNKNVIKESAMDSLKSLFQSFSKADIMRVDCRVDREGNPRLIELSPDCSLAPKSGLYSMFQKAGYSYSAMFDALISATLQSTKMKSY